MVFKKIKNILKGKDKDDTPSEEHIEFLNIVSEIIGPKVEQYDFKFHKKEIKKYFSDITWVKDESYIKVQATTYPTDYPYDFNIALGEGDSDDIWEYDWNSIALQSLAKLSAEGNSISFYDFPYNEDIKPSVETALSHLLTFGKTFLEGDLTAFYEARKSINKEREPYKIISTAKDGKSIITYEAKSAKMKKKYS